MSEYNIIKSKQYYFGDDTLTNCWIPNALTQIEIHKEVFNNVIWQTGYKKQMKKEILTLIDSAKEIICLCSFLFADAELRDALLDKVEEGVRVYILTVPEVHLSKEKWVDDDPRQRDLVNETKKLLNTLHGKVLVRTASFFHSKFLVIDPKTKPIGFLSTANFTTKALQENVELGIKVHDQRALGLYKQFCYGFWKLSQRELKHELLSPIGQYKLNLDLEYPHEILYTMNSNNQSASSSLNEFLLRTLEERSSGTIYIGAYGFTPNIEVTKKLIKFLSKNGKLVVFTRPRTKKSHVTALNQLSKNGAIIMGQNVYHAKFILVESEQSQGAIFTANIDSLGLEEGFESGVILHQSEIELLREIITTWYKIFPFQFQHQVRLKDISGTVKIIRDDKFHQLEIRGSKTYNQPVTLQSLEDIENTEPKLPRFPINEQYQQIDVNLIIELPKLPINIQKIGFKELKKMKFPIYEDSHAYYIPISKEKELKRAIDQKEEILREKILSKKKPLNIVYKKK